jgi:hypothetical protein
MDVIGLDGGSGKYFVFVIFYYLILTKIANKLDIWDIGFVWGVGEANCVFNNREGF